jgi:hypothetical protein
LCGLGHADELSHWYGWSRFFDRIAERLAPVRRSRPCAARTPPHTFESGRWRITQNA